MTAHIPVLLAETLEKMNLQPGQTVIDCTLGNAGHALEIAKRIGKQGTLIGIDLDTESLQRAEKVLADCECQKIYINNNFKNITAVVSEIKNKNGKRESSTIHSILSDLGLAFYHYQEEGKSTGFSFRKEAPLDMRLDQASDLTAAKIVNTDPEEKLVEIFSKYGEEKKSKTVAREIVRSRAVKKFEKTTELAHLIEKIYQGQKNRIHPATKVFQALRIAVNDEFENLKVFIEEAVRLLVPGGRLAIITYHSGEDRLVKQAFVELSTNCICPPEFPVCRCAHRAVVKRITTKPIVASSQEIKNNPSSRSAKLRVIEKI